MGVEFKHLKALKPNIAYATTTVKTSYLLPDRGREKPAAVAFTERASAILLSRAVGK